MHGADGYVRSLDGLRCFAVFIVIWQHSNALVPFGTEGVGVYGVWLFFVLSGFLITGILLRERDRMRAGLTTPGGALRTFYIRRFLRIFPAYYLLLLVLGISAIAPEFRKDFLWYVSYLSNWMMAARGSYPGGTGHLWSLGVEEQFYLIWPLLILLVAARRLPRLLMAAIVLAVVSRPLISMMTHNAVAVTTPTTSNLDSLAIGAVLAWHRHEHPERGDVRNRVLMIGLCVGVLIVMGNAFLSFVIQRGWRVFHATEAVSAALIGAWLVNKAVSLRDGAGWRLLTAKPLVYLGKISYGLYLYHFVLIYAFRHHDSLAIVRRTLGTTEGNLFFAVVSVASIAIAALSWHVFEGPINSLKRFYPYQEPDKRARPDRRPSPVPTP